MKGIVLCDIDDTISDSSSRQYLIIGENKDWDLFHEAGQYDPPIKGMINVIAALANHCDIVFLTGRTEKYKHMTQTWLRIYLAFGMNYDLLMRPNNDYSPTAMLKYTWLNSRFSKERIWVAFDDNPDVVTMFRAEGILCLQAGVK